MNYKQANYGGFVELGDVYGKSLVKEKYDPDIEGSPFLNEEWTGANLITKNGHEIKNISVKLNIESNELYYLDSSGKTMIAVEGNVKKISYTNLIEKENRGYVFKCGYPAFDKQSANYYYQVLTEGKVELLKKEYKTIESYKNDLSGEKRREFIERNRYYIFSAGEMKFLKNEKEFILNLMKDKQSLIEKYLLDNKINFKKIPDVQQLITYYNGLD